MDSHGTIDKYVKKVREDALHAKFMAARKLAISTRLEEAASGRPMAESPSGRVKRAKVHDKATVRQVAARLESYSGSAGRLHRPQRAFVEVEHLGPGPRRRSWPD